MFSGLASDTTLLKIRAKNSDARVYCVQKTFLAVVSTELAEDCCCQQPSELDIGQEALHIFLAWLISRDLSGVTISQEPLAQAWNFGAQYDIPEFQDAVMHQLMPCLREDHVDPDAVIEAYAADERDTKLQRAFIAQIAIDMRRRDEYRWERSTFIDHDMEELQGFYLDVIEALRESDGNTRLNITDYLYRDQDDTE